MELCRHELPVDRCGICTAPPKWSTRATQPKDLTDVVIVAAKVAYPEYLRYSAYVGHPDRPFRNSSRWMGFYAEGEIKVEVPEILHIEHGVVFSTEEAERRRRRGHEMGNATADLIDTLLAETERTQGGRHDVVLLSSAHDPNTLKLAHPIVNDKLDHAGGNTPITLGQYRYTTLAKLEGGPRVTSDLGL